MKNLVQEVAERQEAQKRRAIGVARQAWRPRTERPHKGAGSYRRERGPVREERA